MEVLFVTPRRIGASPAAAGVAVRALAADLVASGARARWLAPRAADEPLDVPIAGVERIDLVSATPGFAGVQSRFVDLPTERALCALLRATPPDVVHVYGFGGAVSYLLPWLADRLGVASVVVVDTLAAVLCHRQTLVDAWGTVCDAWDDPQRCLACCRRPTPAGPGRIGALCRAALRWLGPFGPGPTWEDFANRLDMAVQGLASARVVCVPDATAESALERAGVPKRLLRVGIPAPAAAAWAPLYDLARGGVRADAS